jgi:acyl-CoA dehydrogenase
MKEQATERMRVAANDAMDIHGGKAVIEGPHNYLGSLYRSIPVGITVEGANILTKSLIQFGQGAIRSHPFLLAEITALNRTDAPTGLADFDKVFWRHVEHAFATFGRAFARGWFGTGHVPDAGKASHFYRRMARYASAFALTADLALLTLGGALKRREMLSARFGGLLSELYLLSTALKRWQDEGRQDADLPVLEYVLETGFAEFEKTLDAILRNLPNRFAAALLRVVTLPFGVRARGPRDDVVRQLAELILAPTATRSRITGDIAHGVGDDGLARLEKAFRVVALTTPIRNKLHAAHEHDWRKALEKGVIGPVEAQAMKLADQAVAAAISVDDFAPDQLTHTAREPERQIKRV